jgi:uncharacterized repeat protein (TIGR03803 family)
MTLLSLVINGMAASGQTINTVHNFKGSDGQNPISVLLTQGRDGRLYGTTVEGGANGLGAVFKQRTVGTGNILLHSFSGSDGSFPIGGLTLARDGNFYGTANTGGTAGDGVLFRITSSGTLTVLYNFTGGADGAFPLAPPIEALDGNLYGTTAGSTSQNSTVYKFTPSGVFSTVYTFDPATGYFPNSPVLQASDGTLYVTATSGGAAGCGSIIQITTTGLLNNTHSFDCTTEGGIPIAPLIQASDGNFYGTADSAGINGGGTIFRLTPNWTLNVLYSFLATPNDGKNPGFGLVQGTDNNLYGATAGGGTASAGTLFQVTLGGVYKQLYSFSSTQAVPTQEPVTPVQHTSGMFYGVTEVGGTKGLGSVYTLNMGLGPFITFVRAQGKVGTKAQILGQGLTGTTNVTFNGVPATSFNVVSDTYMTAVVPAGATTGQVVVTTPGGTLTSNKNFRITQ